MEQAENKPWYKHFWPWFLIAIPLSSIIVGTIVFRLASDGTNSLVVDDYYKEGRTINVRLDQIERARELGISTVMTVTKESITIDFVSGKPTDGAALKLDFYHATLPEKDTNILLTRDANGVYRANIEFDIVGKWRLRLTPMDGEWKLQTMVNLPQSKPFEFSPE